MEELTEFVEEVPSTAPAALTADPQPHKIRWKRSLLIRYLRSVCYGERSDVSISIWGRCSQREPGSCALKAFSKDFLRHLDVTRARCFTFTECTTAPEKSNITDMNVLRDLHDTRTALFAFARAMQTERAQQARGSIATMTLSGRLAYNHVHIVCLRNTADEPFEYVAAVMPLEPDAELKVTLAHFTDMDDALAGALKPKQSKKRAPPPPRTKADQLWSIGNPEVSKPNLAMCFYCGRSGSIMMRCVMRARTSALCVCKCVYVSLVVSVPVYVNLQIASDAAGLQLTFHSDGPAGPASLCNTCGLKLSKEYPDTAAHYSDVVIEPPQPISPAIPIISKQSPPTFSPDQELDCDSSPLDALFGGNEDLYQPAAAPPAFFPNDL